MDNFLLFVNILVLDNNFDFIVVEVNFVEVVVVDGDLLDVIVQVTDLVKIYNFIYILYFILNQFENVKIFVTFTFYYRVVVDYHFNDFILNFFLCNIFDWVKIIIILFLS